MSFAIDELVTKTFLEYWRFSQLPFPKVARPENTFMDNRIDDAFKAFDAASCQPGNRCGGR